VAACHSRKPEAMIKVVGNPPRGFAVRRLFHYVARVDKPLDPNTPEAQAGQKCLWLKDDSGRVYGTPEEIEDLAKAWAESFNPDLGKIRELRAVRKGMAQEMEAAAEEQRTSLQTKLARVDDELNTIAKKPSLNAQRRAGRARRDVAHLILSAKAENTAINHQRVLDAAERTAAQYFANHEYVIGLHQDGRYPHVHIVVKSQAKTQEHGKLRLNKPELLQVRTLWAKELTAQGLEHVATLREDRPHVMEEVAAGRATLKGQRKSWLGASIEGMDVGLEYLEKRQGDLQEALRRGQSRQEATEIRRQIGLRLNDLRAQIRNKTKKGDKARQAAFAELLRIERALEKKADPLLRLQELADKAGNHRPVYQMILTAVEAAPHAQAAPKTATDAEAQDTLACAQSNISAAWAELKRGGLTKEEYRISAQVLTIHETEIRKAFGLEAAPRQSQRPQENGVGRETKKTREPRRPSEFER